MTKNFLRRAVSVLLCFCMLVLFVQAYCIPAIAITEVTPQISVGNDFMVALASDGTAYAWGSNFAGMLGNGTNVDSTAPVKVAQPSGVRFASVSAGWNHVIALSVDGQIYAWGSNAYGQLGRDDLEASNLPKQISLPISDTVIAVVAGNSFSLALTENGSVYAWGLNAVGQLGLPVKEVRETSEPIRIEALSEVFVTSIFAGKNTASAITADGKVWLWGNNQDCQCGSSTEGDVIAPAQKSASSSYFAVGMALGNHHSSLVELNGSIKGFGANQYGQLGNGQEPSDKVSAKINAAILPEGVVASKLASGSGHCVMISTAGEVYSFGDNRKGQLGYASDGAYSSTPQKVAIPMENAKAISADACGNTTAVVDSNGFVWVWGENDQGQLGNGSFSDSATPIGVLDEGGVRFCLGRSSVTTVYHSSVTLNATVPPPSYSVEIPSVVSVGELKQTEAQADGSHLVSAPIKISVTDVDHLFGEKIILITVNTESGTFELSDGVYRLPYSVYGALKDTPLMPGEIFASFTQNQSVSGRLTFDQSLITREGSYSGRLIFEVSVQSIAAEQ